MANLMGLPIELVIRIEPPFPNLPQNDQVLHGQGLTIVNAVEAGVPTRGHRHAWNDRTDRAENFPRRLYASVYWIREGELSDASMLVLCDLAQTDFLPGWRDSLPARYFRGCEKDFQSKTLATLWMRDFVAAAVSRHDFVVNLFNLQQHAIYLRLCGTAVALVDPVSGQALHTRGNSFDAAFQRQITYVQLEWNRAVAAVTVNVTQPGASGRRSRRDAAHFTRWKTLFDREVQFPALANIDRLEDLPDRRRPYAEFSSQEKRAFWSDLWTFGIMYNMFSWAEKFVPLFANYNSPRIGQILEDAFCAFADTLWEPVGRPEMEKLLIAQREPSAVIRNIVQLTEDAPRAYRKYRREI